MESYLSLLPHVNYQSKWVAFQIIHIVITQKQNIEKTLKKHEDFKKLSPNDRAYCYQLIYSFFRHARLYVPFLNQFVKKPLQPPFRKVDILLLFATVQMHVMGTPAYAVIDASVEFAKHMLNTKQAQFVNAVLRKASDLGEFQPQSAYYFPKWLRQKIKKAYGQNKLNKMAESFLNQPAIDIYVKEDVKKWSVLLNAKPLYGNSVRLQSSAVIQELPGYAEGKWWVQSVMASSVMSLLGDVNQKQAYDLCAAPGGKTMWLCAHNANVASVDISKNRLIRLHENIERMQFSADIIAADVLKWSYNKTADMIILDVPCSGTGVSHHHPESLWIRDEKELKSLVAIQEKLLQHAANLLKPNATLLYCTCSLLPDEGAHQIHRFLEKNTDFYAEKVKDDELHPLKNMVTNDGYIQSCPDDKPEWGPITGFFAARLRKKN